MIIGYHSKGRAIHNSKFKTNNMAIDTNLISMSETAYYSTLSLSHTSSSSVVVAAHVYVCMYVCT